jgi:hypothetical protein
MLVTPLDGLAQLVNQPPHKLPVQPRRLLLENLEQILLHVLEHEVPARAASELANTQKFRAANVFCLQFSLAPERLAQFNYIVVLEHAQYFDFAQRGLAHDLVILAFFEFFDGDNFVRLLVAALKHNAISTFAHNAQNFVLVHAELALHPLTVR